MEKTVEIVMALEAFINNPQAKEAFSKIIEEANEGKTHSLKEHTKCMILAMLTSNRNNSKLEAHLDELDEVFFHYDPIAIRDADPKKLKEAVCSIRCGNRSIEKQMKALNHNISFLQELNNKHGSLDAFYRSVSKYELVKKLSANLIQMGKPLVSEYLPRVGIDLPKPDVHLRRILGSERLGFSDRPKATINECYEIISEFSKDTSEYEKYIDYLIWTYCAEGEKNICGENPHCDICVIKQFCNKE